MSMHELQINRNHEGLFCLLKPKFLFLTLILRSTYRIIHHNRFQHEEKMLYSASNKALSGKTISNKRPVTDRD